MASSTKTASAKKNTKVAPSKTTSTVKAQPAKKTESKPAVMQSTPSMSHHTPMNQNTAKTNMAGESNMSKVGNMTEKSSVLQNIGKGNPMPNQFPKFPK